MNSDQRGFELTVTTADAERSRKRRMVLRSLEITIEALRERLAQAMTNEQILEQLYTAIQPDGTFHL